MAKGLRNVAFLHNAALGLCLLAIGTVERSSAFESLDRGMIAIRVDTKSVAIGWRFLASDPANIAFNLYYRARGQKDVKLNDHPIIKSTHFIDSNAELGKKKTYWITSLTLRSGRGVPTYRESKELARVELAGHTTVQPYKSFPLQGDYTFSKVGIADLNGDGKYDYVIKQPGSNQDPGQSRRSQGTYKIEAYLDDGTFLWRKDLGWNMNQGVWFTPMIVYDLDGDGKAEVALKTAPYAASYEESLAEKTGRAMGVILSGPEYITVLDGMTGKQKAQANWVERGNPEDWGDTHGNRVNRNQLGIASLDGKRTSLLVARGTYTRMVVDAFDLEEGKLLKRWRWDGDKEDPQVRGQGSHGMHTADLDGDGREEIILGSVALDDDGTVLWNTGMGHNDMGYLADIMPTRPGLEIVLGYETRQDKNGICLVDAATGQIIWGHPYKTTHFHNQGMFGDFVPDNPGMEFYVGDLVQGKGRGALKNYWLYDADSGLLISEANLGGLSPRAIFWSGKTSKAYIPQTAKRTKNGHRLHSIVEYGGGQIGSLLGRIVAIADVLGDWREEIIVSLPGELRIYSTPIPTTRRRVCLMEDSLYRNDVAMQAMGYLYPPQTSYYFR